MPYHYHRKYRKEQLVARRLDSKLFKRLFSYLLPFKGWLCVSIVFLVFSKAVEAFIPIYIGLTAQHILLAASKGEAARQALLPEVLHGCLWMIALLAFSFFLDMCNVIIKSWIGQKAIFNMRLQVYKHILGMPVPYFDKNPVGRLITRTIHDVDQVDQMFTDSVVPLLGNIILFFGIIIGLAVIDWRIALFFCSLLPFVWWVLYIFRTNQRRCYELIRAVVAALNSFIQEYLLGVATIRNFGLVKKENRRFEDINEDHCNAYLESVEHFGLFIAGIDFLSNFSLITAFVILIAFNPLGTGFQIGVYFTFTLYAMMFFRPLIDLAERYNVLQSAFAASERIFDVLDLQVEPEGSEEILQEVQDIAFEDVWFAYEPGQWVLKGLTFEVKKGESLALVGITGAGKSSVMNLLLRFYDYQKGSIRINGRDIREYSLHSLRAQFSVMFQDPFIFSGTIADNICLYDRSIPREKIESAVDYVNLRPLVDSFSDGVSHHLAERGKSLSQGEMQLVALARAVAQDRSVLIFDEATANIDTGTEKMIQEAIGRILRQKTAIVIAHRLSTIKDAAKVIVLHNGVIAESGTHQQLLAAKGIYEKLYRLQFVT